MKTPLRYLFPLGLVLGVGTWNQAAAQCAATTTFAFSSDAANGDWKARPALAVPTGSALTTLGSEGYYSGASGTNAVLRTQAVNGADMLSWSNDYPDNSAANERYSTITFTFNRPVANLTIRLQDVDMAAGFTDEVTFAGSNGGMPVVPTLTKPTGSSTAISGAIATGTQNVDNNTGGTVTASFAGSITRLTLTYRNTVSGVPGNHMVGIEQMTWCRSVPVAANVTNAASLANSLGQTDIDSPTAQAEGTITGYTVTQLPPANEGVLYYNAPVLLGIPNYIALPAGTTISPDQAVGLRFDPAPTFAGGTTTFRYTATDNAGLVSAAATFSIPIQAIAGPAGCAASYFDNTKSSSGLTAEYYAGYFNDNLAFFGGRTPNLRRIDAQVNFPETNSFGSDLISTNAAAGTAANPEMFSTRLRGSIYVPVSGSYTFYISSDDAAYLWLDAAALATTPTAATATVDNGTAHTVRERQATVTLSAGLHNLLLVYGDNDRENSLVFSYSSAISGASISKQPVPTSALCAGPSNLPPVANNVTATLPTLGYALAPLSGTDQDGSITSFTIETLPANGRLLLGNTAVTAGQVILAANAGNLTFVPNAGYVGTASFTYTATDNAGLRSNLAATYTVNAPNRPPVVAGDSRDVPLNTAVNGNVVLNDYDQEQNGFTVALGTAPTHGTLVLNANGTYTYTPATGYTGPDSFTYTACDNAATPLCSGSATVSLRVFSTNTACTSATGSNLLANPAFTSGNTGFATNYSYVASAYVAGNTSTGIYPEGTYTVGPNATTYHPNFQGTGRTGGTSDNFLMVNGAASIRTLYAQTVTVQPNRYYTFSAFFNNLLAPNSGQGIPELGFVINGESVSGTIQLNESPDQWVQFSDVWYSGNSTSATFEIRNVSTATGGNDLGVDDVYFGSCNLAPTAVADVAATTSGASTSLNVLTNDIDPENSFNVATVDLNPGQANRQLSVTTAEGTFTVDNSGVVTFAPVAGFVGTATAPYTVQDAAGAPTNQANIVVMVQQATADVVVALTAPANNATATAGQPITFTVQATNNGTVTASNVAPTLQLPAGLRGLGANGALTFSHGGTYNSSTGLVTFPAVNLAGGANAQYSVTFLVPGSGPFMGTASAASAAVADLTTGNNTASATVNVTPAFDLTTTLQAPANAATGSTLTYTVVTRNNGPSLATGVVQTVSLPGNLTGLFVSNNGSYVYNSASNTTDVTFPSISALPAGQTVSNTISLTAPATAATFTATANVTANGETVPGNNSLTASTAVAASADTPANVYTSLALTSNGVAVTSAAPGAQLTLTAAVTNAGPGTATGVVQQLAVPADLAPSALTISGGGTYNASAGVVTWPATSLVSGTSQTNTVQLNTPAYGPVLFNSNAATTTPDPVAGDNIASLMLTVRPAADVVTTLVGPTAVTAGQRVTYTLTTTNNGSVAAANVQQFLRVPPAVANLTYSSNLPAGTTGTVDVQPNQALLAYPVISSLAPGQTVVNMVSFDAPAGSFTNTAFVTSTTPDNATATNTSTLAVTASRASDVVATISGPDVVVNGTPVVLTVRTLNTGTSPAAGVTTTVQLPVGLTGVTVRDAAGVAINSAYNATTGRVTFPAQTEVVAGLAGSVTNTITFNAPDVAAISATAIATASSATNDVNGTNNATTFTTSVLRPTLTAADVVETLSSNVASQTAGQPILFTLTATNNGTAPATNVVQRVALPAGLDPASLSITNGGTYDPASGLVTFPALTLQASGTAGNAQTSTITVVTPGVGPVTAVASVGSAFSDGTPANNTAVASVTVNSLSNVRAIVRGPSAQTSAQEGTVLPGQPATYLVRVLNDGPSAATGVSISAQIPAGLNPTDVAITGGGSYAPGTGTVTFPAVGTLAAGQAASVGYTITFPVPATAASFPVSATVGASSAQTTTADDTQTYTTTLANQVAVANQVVNNLTAPDGNTAVTALALSPLSASDADGSITNYVITSLPDAGTQGTLFYAADGTNFAPVALSNGRFTLAAATAGNLRFDPVASFVGNAYFTFLAIDNSNAESAPVLYTIPVGQDNTTVFTAATVKGGSNGAYQNGDVITSAFDANGGEYSLNTTTKVNSVTDTGIRVATTDAASTTRLASMGLALNVATGTITVADRTLLRTGSYDLTVTTTDEFGGTSSQLVAFTIGGAPLPVQLVSFSAKSQGANALLTWATTQELNNARFEVERSVNGKSFEKIGQVAGHGTTTAAQQYSFQDAGASRHGAVVYYRLKQVDTDGEAHLTEVQVVRFELSQTPELVLFPSPATDVLHVRLSATASQASVTVYSATGAQVLQAQLDAALSTTLPVSNLPAGTYLVKVQTSNGVSLMRRFVKE
ncbi:Ig-like domain-containing protein [Hymenobacter sublimis]|uniref:Ig-like domain-containing protein n=1 Tax=Hymenobacter sublimis TaxID=2933777 RepID=A0ABY4J5B3_9BACT|nr:Ig-like domain-containing protein [Hymenobacter sublimis]UPL48022.1 Ig-like domain-containing protein [Hymenobacter sublimis]